jgi:hypothetical protein
MLHKVTWSSIALANLFVGWCAYIFCFYPFVMPTIGYWLIFLLAIGGLFSAYRLSTGNHQALKLQLVCSIGVLSIYLLIWVNRLNNYASVENGGGLYLIEMEAKLVAHFLNSGEIMRGVQQVLWDIIPIWIIFWVIIYSKKGKPPASGDNKRSALRRMNTK